MSVQVLLALVDTELFESMTSEQVEAATGALMREIQGDPVLRHRLLRAIEPSVEQILVARSVDSKE